MIYLSAVFFVILTWVLIGPSMPLFLTVGSIAASTILAISFRRSFHRRTIALLVILAVMFIQSLQLILSNPHIELFKPPPTAESFLLIAGSMWNTVSTLFRLNLFFSKLGAVAATFAAIYIYFGRARLEISHAFPGTVLMEAPLQLREIVVHLASRVNIRCPEVCLIDSGTPLACTVRTKRKYVIAVSVGLLESFDANEVEACIAHEMAHLKNNDFTIRFLATLAKVALFSKPLSYLIEPAIYRAREFQADKTAASLIEGPDALVSALTKLRESNSLSPTPVTSTSVCACSFDGKRGVLNVFDKHPTLDSRIRLLEELKSS